MACASATANPFKLPRSKLPPEPYTNIDHSCEARRHRLNALALAGQQQPGAVVENPLFAVGMA